MPSRSGVKRAGGGGGGYTQSQTQAAESGRRTNAGHSQQQSQRGTQRQRQQQQEDEDEDDEDADADAEEGEGAEAQRADNEDGDGEIRRRANDLVRLALFTEQKRVHLRREDILKKVMAPHPKLFKRVFEAAQKVLVHTFGMELVEMPTRAGLEAEEEEALGGRRKSGVGAATQAQDDDLDAARKATGIKKKAASTGSKAYILRSALHPTLIELAAHPDPQLKALEERDLRIVLAGSAANDARAFGDADGDAEAEAETDADEDGGERKAPMTGSIISWSHVDSQLGGLGILYVVLALILVSGRVLSDVDLRSYLKNLHLPLASSREPVHLTNTSTIRSMSTESYLSSLVRQNYLDRRVQGESAGAGSKRPRATQKAARDEDDGGAREMYEWRWGSRAKCEVGEEAVARFVAEFMVGGGPPIGGGESEESEEEDGRVRGGKRGRKGKGNDNTNTNSRAKKEENVKKMVEGIAKAAGGRLADVWG
ncbi:MAGE-domain-containing protein [Coprinopsis marcescibilis]|uniref:MAGE-domain-containing protein n=1 Tax=Coprinopsis marcescibilis TaxID=230819 RepID=A0A5C3KI14_COPMA|nr:MAGE-domain-containing protein [Coprinopsis marcescibilis]